MTWITTHTTRWWTTRRTSTRQPTTWATTARAILHYLTGCAIGEVLGMVIGTALGLHNDATVMLSIVLAFLSGYG